MNKHQAKTAATRTALMGAFSDLYQKKPVEEMAIKEITAIAGCNRTTFYEHFKSVYDVLDELEQTAIVRVIESMNALAPQMGNLRGAFTDRFLALCEENFDLFHLLLSGSRSHRFKERLQQAVRPYVEANLGIVGSAGRQGAQYLVDFYLAGVVAVASNCIVAGGASTLESAADTIDGILEQGVVATAKALFAAGG